MKKLILKWLGLANINERLCHLEAHEHINELRMNGLEKMRDKLDFVYEETTFDAFAVFEKYKYFAFNKIPEYVLDIFLKTFQNIQFKDSGADTIIYYNDQYVGYTQFYFGQILDSINEKRAKNE